MVTKLVKKKAIGSVSEATRTPKLSRNAFRKTPLCHSYECVYKGKQPIQIYFGFRFPIDFLLHSHPIREPRPKKGNCLRYSSRRFRGHSRNYTVTEEPMETRRRSVSRGRCGVWQKGKGT